MINNLKTFIFLKTIIISSISGYAQTTNVGNTSKSAHLNVYRNALSAGDYATAIIALNYVVALESKTGKYRDSLAMLYFASGNFNQSLYWCNEILKTSQSNLQILEIKAANFRQTNHMIQAIETYEQLILIKPNPIYFFNLIELQYHIKRLLECVSSTEIVEKLDTKDLFFSYKLNDTETAKTPLMAALFNYRGLAYYELGQKKEAKKAFEMALVLDSNFLLAKTNLKTVKEPENEGSQQQTSPSLNRDIKKD